MKILGRLKEILEDLGFKPGGKGPGNYLSSVSIPFVSVYLEKGFIEIKVTPKYYFISYYLYMDDSFSREVKTERVKRIEEKSFIDFLMLSIIRGSFLTKEEESEATKEYLNRKYGHGWTREYNWEYYV